MGVFQTYIEELTGKNLRIIYPESLDVRTLGAAIRHEKDGIIHPVVLGNPDEVRAFARANDLYAERLEIIDPETYPDREKMAQAFVERRKGKATLEQARAQILVPNYFGTMLVYMGLADGMVSGARNSTADTVRPALQIVKTKPGIKMVSGAMLMAGPNGERYLFADTAINIQPTASDLADIAFASYDTAKWFGIDEPKIAMLSFSTKGSAHSPEQEKMAEATKIALERHPDLPVDGEMQFDAALVPSVGALKAPGSKIAGHANVFIFPDLQAGNIGYKIGQRFGHFQAIGPILQGIAKPINDLSRGCTEEEAYKLGIITASQALDLRK